MCQDVRGRYISIVCKKQIYHAAGGTRPLALKFLLEKCAEEMNNVGILNNKLQFEFT